MSDVFDKQSVTTELAHRIVSAAEAKAAGMGVPMVIAVCDESGMILRSPPVQWAASTGS